ncbi:MAG: hypothetical protein ACXW6R_04740, partial [Candidatus Binatia bacterium]
SLDARFCGYDGAPEALRVHIIPSHVLSKKVTKVSENYFFELRVLRGEMKFFLLSATTYGHRSGKFAQAAQTVRYCSAKGTKKTRNVSRKGAKAAKFRAEWVNYPLELL